MNYSDFKELCDARKFQVNDICCHIGMTYHGLKQGLTSGKIGSDKVVALCKVLGITPNNFFGWEKIAPVTAPGETNPYAQQTIDVLREQIRIKDEQIAHLIDGVVKQVAKPEP